MGSVGQVGQAGEQAVSQLVSGQGSEVVIPQPSSSFLAEAHDGFGSERRWALVSCHPLMRPSAPAALRSSYLVVFRLSALSMYPTMLMFNLVNIYACGSKVKVCV